MMLKKVCVVSAMVLFACGESEVIDGAELETVNQEIVDNLLAAGYPESEIEVGDDGVVIVGGDAVVTLQASREMIGLDGHEEHAGEIQFRQYRTTNLVDPGIAVICIDGSSFSGTLSTALDKAIANYTSLNLSFDMVRTNGSDAGCDAEITMTAKGAAGGSSGFPEGGLPYSTVNVGKSTGNYGLAVATHVITHELGHCIGFRHSDYYNRAISCGTGGNEGDGGVGAIHIPGTPTTAVLDGSVMNSCFNQGSTGQWTASDLTALNALY
ncbi:M57 family metalloprotease [Nannocystis radixulma]|nr:M57 family metalloprotease [Nannocystis radixulma]